MFEGIMQTITNPKAFFERLHEDDTLASRALWVVALVAAVSGGAGYFSALPIASVMGDGSLIGSVTVLSGTLGLVAATFLSWLATGLLIRITAGISTKPWAITGYAMSPYLLIYLLFIVLAAVFPVTLPTLGADLSSDPEGFAEALAQAQTLYTQSTYARLTQGLSYLGTLWWVVLVFLGVDAAAGRNKAFLAAGLIAFLNLAFIVVPFLLQPV